MCCLWEDDSKDTVEIIPHHMQSLINQQEGYKKLSLKNMLGLRNNTHEQALKHKDKTSHIKRLQSKVFYYPYSRNAFQRLNFGHDLIRNELIALK